MIIRESVLTWNMDIHNEVWESLGFYVYAYVDPTDLAIRYIGKGTGNRALSHLDSTEESEKVEWIQGLKKVGKEPQIDIIARNLTEENALLIERSLIDVIGLGHGKLTNKVRGHDVQSGRESIQEIAIKLNPQQADFKHKILMLRLNQHWRPNMSEGELYDITRGIWKLGAKRERVELVLAVSNGIVRQVYIPDSWHPAGTTTYSHKHPDIEEKHRSRWEFVGKPATAKEHLEYMHKDVSGFYKKGEQTSTRYTFQ
tara:strand:- start:226 stop:993 length:768 start_codon:yes stop_codon:yes gene_type:complete